MAVQKKLEKAWRDLEKAEDGEDMVPTMKRCRAACTTTKRG
jgi:hypothetical protein